MKQRKCPYSFPRGCIDYGRCENCSWNAIIEENKKLKKEKKELKFLLYTMYFYWTGSTDKEGLNDWIKKEEIKQ